MRTLVLSLCFALTLAIPTRSPAQDLPPIAPHTDPARVPQVVFDGLAELRRDRLDDAENAWRKDSSFLQPGAASGALRTFKQNDGEFQDFEVIAINEVAQRTRVVYLVLNYERQPHFARFIAYRTAKEWILLQLDLNIDMATMQADLANRTVCGD